MTVQAASAGEAILDRPLVATPGRKHSQSGWLRGARLLQPTGVISGIAIVLLIVAAVLADVLSPRDPTQQTIREALQTPLTISGDGTIYVLGTDAQGRDVLSRMLHGARVSLSVGVGAVAIGTIGGLILGIMSGYR